MNKDQEKAQSKERSKTPNRFLPQLAQISSKPQWQQAAPSFHLRADQESEKEYVIKNERAPGYKEHTRHKGKKRKQQFDENLPGPSPKGKGKSPHKEREHFRSALVNIIIYSFDLKDEEVRMKIYIGQDGILEYHKHALEWQKDISNTNF